jgi:hypothetical protein
MLKNFVLFIAFLTINNGVLAADATVPAEAAQVQNPHLSRDARLRTCKIEADQKQLSGDQRNQYVTSCMQRS